jgi:hypothetical protein
MAERLDQKICNRMVEVARVEGQKATYGNGDSHAKLLPFSRFATSTSKHGTFQVKLTALIVCAVTNTLNERTFRTVSSIVIEEIILKTRCALGSRLMHTVAHVMVSIKIGRRILQIRKKC